MRIEKSAYGWAGLIGLWLVLVASAFWFIEYQYWQTFKPSTVIFEGAQLQTLLQRLPQTGQAVGQYTIVHFTDEQCPCVSYSKQHIKSLQPILSNTQQVVLKLSDAPMDGIWVPAIPSVAVWDELGKLAYFGPYSSGLHCGQGDDFVKAIIQQLEQQVNPGWINMVGHGCYCSGRRGAK